MENWSKTIPTSNRPTIPLSWTAQRRPAIQAEANSWPTIRTTELREGVMKYRLACFTVVLIALCGAFLPAAASAQNITIQGNAFYKDGHPWRAKGIDTETFITCSQHTSGKYTPLRKYWGSEKLEKIRANFHIDTLRIYVSQIGLDLHAAVCGADYKDEIVEATRLALSKGLVVILQLDWQ